MTEKDKLADVIEETLDKVSDHGYDLTLAWHRRELASYIASALLEDSRQKYRSGRRLSDRLRDRLLDLQKWVWPRKQ